MSSSALFTVYHNDDTYIGYWIKNHLQEFDKLFILSHKNSQQKNEFLEKYGEHVTIVDVYNEKGYDPLWVLKLAKSFQHFLLHSFDLAFFCAADELIIKSPEVTFDWLLKQSSYSCLACDGYNLVDLGTSGDLDFVLPIFPQRNSFEHSVRYSKVIGGRLMCYWHPGFFSASNYADYSHSAVVSDNLKLIHLHKADKTLTRWRHMDVLNRPWDESVWDSPIYRHNRITSTEQLEKWFGYSTDDIAFSNNAPGPVKFTDVPDFVKDRLGKLCPI